MHIHHLLLDRGRGAVHAYRKVTCYTWVVSERPSAPAGPGAVWTLCAFLGRKQPTPD